MSSGAGTAWLKSLLRGDCACRCGGFAAVVYLITKFLVLKAKNPVMAGLITAPVYFFVVSGVLTMSIIVKGSPSLNLDDLPATTIVAAVWVLQASSRTVGAVLAALCSRQSGQGRLTLKWYHFFMGPLLWSRPAPEDAVTADSRFLITVFMILQILLMPVSVSRLLLALSPCGWSCPSE